MKSRIYGFHPSQLSEKEQEAKAKEMDRFWNFVKQNRPEAESCLIDMIQAAGSDSFFAYDAANLLWQTDPSDTHAALVAAVMAKSDLSDLNVADFIDLALRVGSRGADIGPVAHNYMRHPKVTIYLPRHGGYELDRTRGAILLYGSMPPDVADRYLSQEVHASDPEVVNSAAIVWAFNLTEKSFQGIQQLQKDPRLPEEARGVIRMMRKWQPVEIHEPAKYNREQILKKIRRLPELDPGITEEETRELDNSVYVSLQPGDLDELAAAKRRMIAGLSDEAVDGYLEIGRIQLNLINKLDLYSIYREH